MTADAKILLIDDSSTIRGLLSRLINGQPGMQVIGTAANGKLGVERVRALNPDLVVLDIEMPVMTGLEALAEIRKSHPRLPVIMFSTLTENGAEATLTALELGASAYATKPQSSGSMVTALEVVKDDLVSKIKALVDATSTARSGSSPAVKLRKPPPAPPSATPARRTASIGRIQAVVLGSSTGGPNALEKFLLGIVNPLPVPMFITQHMPPTFTAVLAKRLNTKVSSTVVEGQDGMVAKPGHCYIAPGGLHMGLEAQGTSTVLVVEDGPMINSCKPSVEPLFSSAAGHYGSLALAVMLTGMGSDGVDGTGELAAKGASVIVQDEETSVVWGMPGAVAKAGLATEILPLDEIGPRVAMLAGATATARPASRANPTPSRRAGALS
jgi:two-component system chemotaxis response regulator CheB